MNVTDRRPESKSADLSGAAQELSLCVNGKDLQKIAKVLLQVVWRLKLYYRNDVYSISESVQTS